MSNLPSLSRLISREEMWDALRDFDALYQVPMRRTYRRRTRRPPAWNHRALSVPIGSDHRDLVVIDSYRLGFNIENERGGARATVFIDYVPAQSGLVRLLSLPLARAYGRWCVQRMADDVQARFGTARATAT